jgi:opacity protein-like surface antigen
MKSKIVALALALVGTAVCAQSKSNAESYYAELGINFTQYTLADLSFSNANNYGLRLGKNLSENFAVEGVYVSGTTDASYSSSATGAMTFKQTGSYGLYIKPKAKLSDDLELFGRLGYFRSNGTLTSSILRRSEDTSDNSVSYGLGVSYNITRNVYASLDYMQWLKKDGADIKGFGLNVGFNF